MGKAKHHELAALEQLLSYQRVDKNETNYSDCNYYNNWD